jgi:hypothetical protein
LSLSGRFVGVINVFLAGVGESSAATPIHTGRDRTTTRQPTTRVRWESQPRRLMQGGAAVDIFPLFMTHRDVHVSSVQQSNNPTMSWEHVKTAAESHLAPAKRWGSEGLAGLLGGGLRRLLGMIGTDLGTDSIPQRPPRGSKTSLCLRTCASRSNAAPSYLRILCESLCNSQIDRDEGSSRRTHQAATPAGCEDLFLVETQLDDIMNTLCETLPGTIGNRHIPKEVCGREEGIVSFRTERTGWNICGGMRDAADAW